MFVHGLVPETSLGGLYTAPDTHSFICARSGRLRFCFRLRFGNCCNRRLSGGVDVRDIIEAYYIRLVPVDRWDRKISYPGDWLYHCRGLCLAAFVQLSASRLDIACRFDNKEKSVVVPSRCHLNSLWPGKRLCPCVLFHQRDERTSLLEVHWPALWIFARAFHSRNRWDRRLLNVRCFS